MPEPQRFQLVLNESSLNFILQLPARKRDRLLRGLRQLAQSPHEELIGIEKDLTGRDLYVRIVGEWEVTFWADWEKELRIVRLANA